MPRYEFASGPLRLKGADYARANVQRIGTSLAAMAAANGGRLTPRHTWQSVQGKPDHPLYPLYEWDVEKAAALHWDDTSRAIIRIIREIPDGARGRVDPVPSFLSVDDHGYSYRTIHEVRTSLDLQLAILKQAERDLEAFERRYRELKDICRRVAEIRDDLRRRFDPPPDGDHPSPPH